MASPRRADDMATDTVTLGDDRSVLSSDPVADLSPAPSLGPGSSTPRTSWARRIAAESFGTFALVFVAVGADAMASLTGGEIGTAARAIAPALMVAALIYAIGDGSGAHFNPAVSLAFALKRLFPCRGCCRTGVRRSSAPWRRRCSSRRCSGRTWTPA